MYSYLSQKADDSWCHRVELLPRYSTHYSEYSDEIKCSLASLSAFPFIHSGKMSFLRFSVMLKNENLQLSALTHRSFNFFARRALFILLTSISCTSMSCDLSWPLCASSLQTYWTPPQDCIYFCPQTLNEDKALELMKNFDVRILILQFIERKMQKM